MEGLSLLELLLYFFRSKVLVLPDNKKRKFAEEQQGMSSKSTQPPAGGPDSTLAPVPKPRKKSAAPAKPIPYRQHVDHKSNEIPTFKSNLPIQLHIRPHPPLPSASATSNGALSVRSMQQNRELLKGELLGKFHGPLTSSKEPKELGVPVVQINRRSKLNAPLVLPDLATLAVTKHSLNVSQNSNDRTDGKGLPPSLPPPFSTSHFSSSSSPRALHPPTVAQLNAPPRLDPPLPDPDNHLPTPEHSSSSSAMAERRRQPPPPPNPTFSTSEKSDNLVTVGEISSVTGKHSVGGFGDASNHGSGGDDSVYSVLNGDAAKKESLEGGLVKIVATPSSLPHHFHTPSLPKATSTHSSAYEVISDEAIRNVASNPSLVPSLDDEGYSVTSHAQNRKSPHSVPLPGNSSDKTTPTVAWDTGYNITSHVKPAHFKPSGLPPSSSPSAMAERRRQPPPPPNPTFSTSGKSDNLVTVGEISSVTGKHSVGGSGDASNHGSGGDDSVYSVLNDGAAKKESLEGGLVKIVATPSSLPHRHSPSFPQTTPTCSTHSSAYEVISDEAIRNVASNPSLVPSLDDEGYSITSHAQNSKFQHSVPLPGNSSDKTMPTIAQDTRYDITSHIKLSHCKSSSLAAVPTTNPASTGEGYSRIPHMVDASSAANELVCADGYTLIAVGTKGDELAQASLPPSSSVLSSAEQVNTTCIKPKQRSFRISSNSPALPSAMISTSPKPVRKVPTPIPGAPKPVSSPRLGDRSRWGPASPGVKEKPTPLSKPAARDSTPQHNMSCDTGMSQSHDVSHDTEVRCAKTASNSSRSDDVEAMVVSSKTEVDIDQIIALKLYCDRESEKEVRTVDVDKEGSVKQQKEEVKEVVKLGRGGGTATDLYRRSYVNLEVVDANSAHFNFETSTGGSAAGNSYTAPLGPSEVFTVPQHAVPGLNNYCELDVDTVVASSSNISRHSANLNEEGTFVLSGHSYPDARGYYDITVNATDHRKEVSGLDGGMEDSQTSGSVISKSTSSEGKWTSKMLSHKLDNDLASVDGNEGDVCNGVAHVMEAGVHDLAGSFSDNIFSRLAKCDNDCDSVDQSNVSTSSATSTKGIHATPTSTVNASSVMADESISVAISSPGHRINWLEEQRPTSVSSENDNPSDVSTSPTQFRSSTAKKDHLKQDRAHQTLSSLRRPPPPPPPPSSAPPAIPKLDSYSLSNSEERVLRTGFRMFPPLTRTKNGEPSALSGPAPTDDASTHSKSQPHLPSLVLPSSSSMSSPNSMDNKPSQDLVPLTEVTNSSSLKKILRGLFRKSSSKKPSFVRYRSMRNLRRKSKPENGELTEGDRMSKTLPYNSSSLSNRKGEGDFPRHLSLDKHDVLDRQEITADQDDFGIYSTIPEPKKKIIKSSNNDVSFS